MTECIREIDAFYEADSVHAVAEEQARFILEAAIGSTMEHTYATVALRSLQAFSIGDEAAALRIAESQVGLHTVWLTRRLIEGADGQVAEDKAGIAALRTTADPHGTPKVDGSGVLVRVTGKRRRGDRRAIDTTVHELAHTFYMPHCQRAGQDCVMKANFKSGLIMHERISPFCYCCTSDFRKLTNLYLSETSHD